MNETDAGGRYVEVGETLADAAPDAADKWNDFADGAAKTADVLGLARNNQTIQALASTSALVSAQLGRNLTIYQDIVRNIGAQQNAIHHALAAAARHDLQFAIPARIMQEAVAQPALQAIATLVSRWTALFNTAFGGLLASLQTFDWSGLAQLAAQAQRVYERQEVRDAFTRANLWPAPSMPPDLRLRVVELHRAGSPPHAVSNAVSGRYSRQTWSLLDEVTKNWNRSPILRPREQTLEQAAWAMRHQKFALVAPALVPLVEGVSADFIFRMNGGPRRVSHGQLRNDLESAIPPTGAYVLGLDVISTFLDFIEDVLFSNVDFTNDYYGVRQQSVLNRHVLLHGRGVRQQTRMNGLRAFLLLDVLGAVVVVAESN